MKSFIFYSPDLTLSKSEPIIVNVSSSKDITKLFSKKSISIISHSFIS